MQKDHRDIDGYPPPRKSTNTRGVSVDHFNSDENSFGTAFPSSLSQYRNMSASESKSSGDRSSDDTGEFDDVFIRQQAEMLRRFEEHKLSPKKNAPKNGNEEHLQEDPHAHGLIDQSIIEAQCRIYEEIQRQRYRASLKSDSYQKQALVSKKTAASKSSTQYPRTDNITEARARTVSNDTPVSSQSGTKTTFDKAQRVTDDQVILYDNEKKLLVKGTHHVIHSIANGSAVIVQCPSCQAVSQVDKSCTMLYCVYCHQVSPLDSDSAMTMNYTMTESMPDALAEHIVRTVQRQEIDVAAARRAAKSAQSNGQTR